MQQSDRIFDISMPLGSDTPVWPGSEKFSLRWLKSLSQDGVNESALSLSSHTGTHIDFPAHFISGGRAAGDFHLDVLVGDVFVLDYPGESDIGVDFLESADIPQGCRRLIFKTQNSAMSCRDGTFTEDFVALSLEGAEWVAEAGVGLVGIDYLSIQRFGEEGDRTHKILLQNDIVILEGLCLGGVSGGTYELFALPLNVPEAEGAPARAILVKREMS